VVVVVVVAAAAAVGRSLPAASTSLCPTARFRSHPAYAAASRPWCSASAARANAVGR
jgi:hypothetical protein